MLFFVVVFIENYKVRMVVVVIVVILVLLVFGVIGVVLGKISVFKLSVRVVIGGWMVMVFIFGFIKFIGFEVM